MDARTHKDRAFGAAFGQAVGDALGTTLEFEHITSPAWPERMRGPHTEIIGAGPFGLAPGQVTDDTHMAVCIARVLLEYGSYSAHEAVKLYAEWAKHTFDIGGTTSGGIRGSVEYGPRGGYVSWNNSGRRSAGNGSLMRTSTIGTFYALKDDGLRRAVSIADSAITHADPRCTLACASYNAAIAEGIRGGDSQAMWQAARDEVDIASAMLLELLVHYRTSGEFRTVNLASDMEVLDAAAGVKVDLDDALSEDMTQPDYGGFVRTAFRVAFYQLLHAESFEDALLDTVNRGGDADTNGAIVGALLGARYGAEGISEDWKTIVMTCTPKGSKVFNETYHPRTLLQLVDVTYDD